MAWRLAGSLVTFRDQLNTMYPNRNKASDGTIGDAAHQAEGSASDHNPWYVRDGIGVVTAIDITHDPINGLSVDALSDQLAASRDPRIKYIIANNQIMVPSQGWNWQQYDGTDPHTSHVHLSVVPTLCDQTKAWDLKEEDMPEPISLEGARLLAFTFRGYNGITQDKNALNGSIDADLNVNHVGKPLTVAYLRSLFNSTDSQESRETLSGLNNEALKLREVVKSPGAAEDKLNQIKKIVGE